MSKPDPLFSVPQSYLFDLNLWFETSIQSIANFNCQKSIAKFDQYVHNLSKASRQIAITEVKRYLQKPFEISQPLSSPYFRAILSSFPFPYSEKVSLWYERRGSGSGDLTNSFHHLRPKAKQRQRNSRILLRAYVEEGPVSKFFGRAGKMQERGRREEETYQYSGGVMVAPSKPARRHLYVHK